MARLPTGCASTTSLAGAQVHPRRLEAQGPKRRSRQSGRVVTAAVYLLLGKIQMKALPTRPTGSGIHLKIPPVDSWTTQRFYFPRILSTDRFVCSERYRANLHDRSGPFHTIEIRRALRTTTRFEPISHCRRMLQHSATGTSAAASRQSQFSAACITNTSESRF